jgi:hypothetical protein
MFSYLKKQEQPAESEEEVPQEAQVA